MPTGTNKESKSENKIKRGNGSGVGRLWDDVQSVGFYCSQVLDPSSLSLLQTSSIFRVFHMLYSNIRGGVAFILKVSI